MSNKLTCVRVLREARSKAQSNQMLLGIPREHQDALGWKAGDKVYITTDARTGIMKLRVAPDEQ